MLPLDAAELLSEGDVFVKFHERTNKSAKRFMFYESGTLYWCKEGSRSKSSKHSCSLSQISRVAVGKDADLPVFSSNEAAKRAPADLCLSLVFASAGMSLNLQAPSQSVRDAWCEAITVVQEHRAASRNSQSSSQQRHPYDGRKPDNPNVAPLDRFFSPPAPAAHPHSQPDDDQQQQQQSQHQDDYGYDDVDGPNSDQQAQQQDGYADDQHASNGYEQEHNAQPAHATFQPRGAHEDYDDFNQPEQDDFGHRSEQRRPQHSHPLDSDHAAHEQGHRYEDEYGDSYDDDQPHVDQEPPMPALPDSAREYEQQQDEQQWQQQRQQQQRAQDSYLGDGGSDDEDFSAAKSPLHGGAQGQQQQRQQQHGFDKFGGSSSAGASAAPAVSASRPPIPAQRPPIPAQRPPKSSPPPAAVAAVPPQSSPPPAAAAAAAEVASVVRAAASRGPSRGQVLSGKPLPKVHNPRLRGSPFDRHVLQDPLPPDQRHMVDVALAAVLNAAQARIVQKAESARLVQQLQAELQQQELEFSALGARNSAANDFASSGAISIRLATANLDHAEPHHYTAMLWVRHPLEDHFEYSQSASLMRSLDGETYAPRLLLAPTDLFALREPEPDVDGYDQEQEGQLVGALLRIEIWDLVRDPNSDVDAGRGLVVGFVEVDMNDLIAAPHHVMGLALRNDTDRARDDQWAAQGAQIVLQYCLPAAAAQPPPDQPDGNEEPASALAAGCTDPRMTLRLQQLESELSSLGVDAASYQQQALRLSEERARANALEARLAQEQVVRVRHEQENMRLRPRVLEAVDASAELQAGRRQVKELESLVSSLQRDLRAASVPPDAHAMLDELLSLEQPSRANLTRIKRFVLEQERVRTMLVAELGGAAAAAVTTETTHDELVRREAALQAHALQLETDKRAHESHAAAMRQALAAAQAQALQLSARCEAAEAEAQHAQVSIAFLQEQLRAAQQRPGAGGEDDRMDELRQQLMKDTKGF